MPDIKPLIFNLDELKEKALKGDGLAAYLLGRSFFSAENGAECDYQEAVKWYQYGAEKLKDAKCIYGLGICYDDGVGNLKQDSQKADELFRLALKPLKKQVKQNDLFAMFILGAYYFYGFADVEENKPKAFAIISRSALQGHIAAIYDLGVFYHNGVGVEIDFIKAKAFLEIAAKANLARAKQKLIEWENDFNQKENL